MKIKYFLRRKCGAAAKRAGVFHVAVSGGKVGKDTKADDKEHAAATDGKGGMDPWEILDDIGNQLEKTVRMFDIRLMNNKNGINDIKGYLNKLIEECQISLEYKIDLFDGKVNALIKEVEKLEREKG